MLVDPVNNRGGTGPIQRCSVRLLPGCSASSSVANMILLREEDDPRFLSKERSRDETGHRYPIPWLKSSRQHQTGFTRCKTTPSRRGVCAPASAPTSRQFQLQVNLARQLFHSPRRSCRTTAPDDGAASVPVRTRSFHNKVPAATECCSASVSAR